ncbi:hypothetical protein Hanom_Chr06g00497961 [Helianthus anomalus]
MKYKTKKNPNTHLGVHVCLSRGEEKRGKPLSNPNSDNWNGNQGQILCMDLNTPSSSLAKHVFIIGITRAWAKHGRLTGQDEARKRLRARMHKVSELRSHF